MTSNAEQPESQGGASEDAKSRAFFRPATRITSADCDSLIADLKTRDNAERYLLGEEIGSGGQGSVFEVWDESLKRELAMKVARGSGESSTETETPKPGSLSRFVDEAQITGQLNHPGVVPVHDLGVDADGRVFFTMLLVRGERMSDVIERVHSGDPDWTMARAMGVLLRACEALAYAHSRGVVHRDLKPANLMVGKYGEAYVMDWGLARIVDEPDSHDLRLRVRGEGTPATGRTESRESESESPLMTLDGHVIGTPHHMSPEQASGRVNEIGFASDVYSMGTVLYQLLTGAAPYSDSTLDEESTPYDILDRVVGGSPAAVTELAPDTAPELLAINEKAMARRIEDRYSDMSALAADLRAFLEGRVVQAFEAGPWAELRKWVVRNRGWAATGAVAAALLCVALGWALIERHNAEAARTEEATRAGELQRVLEFQRGLISGVDVPGLSVALRTQLTDQVRDHAREHGATDKEVALQEERLEDILSVVDFASLALTQLETGVFGEVSQAIVEQFPDEKLIQVRLFETVGDTLYSWGLWEAASQPIEHALTLARTHLGEEHPTTISVLNSAGKVSLAKGELAEAESRLSSALTQATRHLGSRHRVTASCLHSMGACRQAQGDYKDAMRHFEEALELRRKELGREHPDTLSAKHGLGACLRGMGDLSRAETTLQEAYKLRSKVLGPTDRRTLASLNALAGVAEAQDRLPEAEELCRRAWEARQTTLGHSHPDTLDSLHNLAQIVQLQGKLDLAEELLREALDARKAVAGAAHPKTTAVVASLGLVLKRQGKLREAEACYRDALEATRARHGEAHPRALLDTLNLAALLQEAGRYTRAESLTRRGLELSREVLPVGHSTRRHFLNNMGAILMVKGDAQAAEEHLREALEESWETLGREHRDSLSVASNLANCLATQGQLEDAEQLAREVYVEKNRLHGADDERSLLAAVALCEVLVARKKDNEEDFVTSTLARCRMRLGDENVTTIAALGSLGTLLQSQGKLEDAERHLAEASDTARRILLEGNPARVSALHNYASLLLAMERHGDAEGPCIEALELAKNLHGPLHPLTIAARSNLRELTLALGKYGEAERSARDVLAATEKQYGANDSRTLRALIHLGRVLESIKELDEAAECYREAGERADSLGDELRHLYLARIVGHLGLVRRKQQQPVKAEAALQEALAAARKIGDGKTADTAGALSNLRRLYRDQRRFVKAEECSRECVEVNRRLYGDDHQHTIRSIGNHASSLRSLGRLEESERLAAATAQWARDNTESGSRLQASFLAPHAHTLRAMGRFAEATALFEEICSVYKNEPEFDPGEVARTTSHAAKCFEEWFDAESGGGHDVKAQKYYEEMVAAARQLSSGPNQTTANALQLLALLHRKQGKLVDAERCFRESESINVALHGVNEWVIYARGNLGGILRERGRLNEANQLGKEAVWLARDILPPKTAEFASVIAQHGHTLLELERFAEAEQLFKETLSAYTTSVGLSDARTVAARSHLVRCYRTWHKVDPNGGYDKKAGDLEKAPKEGDED